jgi:hypothetical protein
MSFRRVAVAMMACAIALAVDGCSSHHHAKSKATTTTTTSPSASTPPPAPPLTPARAQAIGTAFSGSNASSIAQYLAPAVRTEYLQTPSPLWPAGSSVTVDVADFKRSTATVATVPAVVTGTEPGRFTLLLVYTDNAWDVLATAKVS